MTSLDSSRPAPCRLKFGLGSVPARPSTRRGRRPSGVAARRRFAGCALAGCFVLAVCLARAEAAAASAWALQSLAAPSLTGQQSAVSCPSVTACAAVGHYFSTTGIEVTLAERWNGTSWAIQISPNPSGAAGSGLDGVSCTSATACTAVGSYTGATGATRTLAERWNGATWAIQSTPNPIAATSSSLSSVSCTSNTSCTAVGYFQNSAGTFLTLAERWNGTELGDPGNAEPERREDQRVGRRLVSRPGLVHRRRALPQQRRRGRDARGALERYSLDDPDHPEPERSDRQLPD